MPTNQKESPVTFSAQLWYSVCKPREPETCQMCGRRHFAHQPHDPTSPLYALNFRSTERRWPSWKDAMSHCSPKMQDYLLRMLRKHHMSAETHFPALTKEFLP